MLISKFKRFQGASLEDAEAKAIHLFGPATRIHSTRTVRGRGIFGYLGRKEFEVIASPARTLDRASTSPYPARRRLLSRLDDATDPVRRIFDGIQALTVLFDHLRHRGVSDSLAEGIILSLREIVPPARMGDFSLVKEALRQKIRRMMRCSWGIDPSFDSNVAVFVGPTGAGKTTTVAKIAASMRLVHHLDVALISTDTFRVGAMDQISAYAEAIGTPMRVVRNEVEMMTAVRDLSHCQVVLIDTAGLGSRGSEWVDRLGLAVKSIAKCTTYLLLDMGAHLQNQMAVLRRLGGLRIDNFVFTKADECAVHGQILDLLVYTGVPVAYITNGQNVPGDIQAARTEDLADLILGPEYPQLRPPG